MLVFYIKKKKKLTKLLTIPEFNFNGTKIQNMLMLPNIGIITNLPIITY